MGKYFGTDGARGKANENLTLDMAVKIGQYVGYYYSKKFKRHARIVIGKDTRLSSDMFESGIAAGAISTGANVYEIGVCTTPCVAYLINRDKFDCGIMISASHNPFYDNGIKLFSSTGKKMPEDVLLEIEDYMDGARSIELAYEENIGQAIDYSDGLALYEAHLKDICHHDLNGMKIALDLANGSATSCAVDVFRDLGAELKVIHSNPDGTNINTNCGSTHPASLQELMRSGKYDVGFAFDGDADRLIAVDEEGNLINGDYTIFICGKYLRDKGELNDNMVVTTVMANLGLYKALAQEHINDIQTQVGDKYVFEEMEKNDYVLGGEQSGHIIFKKYETTGDGLLTALMLTEVMRESGLGLKELGKDLFIYPQLLINVKVADKQKAMEDAELDKVVKSVAETLGDEGRILVRPSGTEPLVRVMVEAKTDDLCEKYVGIVVDYIKQRGL